MAYHAAICHASRFNSPCCDCLPSPVTARCPHGHRSASQTPPRHQLPRAGGRTRALLRLRPDAGGTDARGLRLELPELGHPGRGALRQLLPLPHRPWACRGSWRARSCTRSRLALLPLRAFGTIAHHRPDALHLLLQPHQGGHSATGWARKGAGGHHGRPPAGLGHCGRVAKARSRRRPPGDCSTASGGAGGLVGNAWALPGGPGAHHADGSRRGC